MQETMGKRIAANRKGLGLTQDQMAEQLGVTAQAVSKWENDQSCPDITMLPRIAQLFGITTDALLGVENRVVHEATVEPDQNSGPEEGRDDKDGFVLEWENSKKGSIGLAVWVLLSGVLLMASRILNWGANLWDIVWPLGLVIFGIWGILDIQGWKLKRFSFFRLAMILLGGYYLVYNLGFAQARFNRELLLPGCLVLFGVSILVDALQKRNKGGFKIVHNGHAINKGGDFFEEGDSFRCNVSFGENSKTVRLPLVRRGDMEANFGELRVDLTQCALADGCVLNAECSFGEIQITLPRSCVLSSDASQAFGSVEYHGAPDPDASTKVYLQGSANFGQISVQYI